MKLNLLPKIVDTASRAKRALFGSLLLFLLSLAGAFFMAKVSGERLAKSKEEMASSQAPYDAVVKIATEADTMMTQPQVRQAVVNAGLAEAMNKANTLYPDIYDFVKPYVPSFFRITSLNATPIDATTSSVSMVGTVKNAQEYADLMFALLRIPGATSVSRAGFSADDMFVPPLTSTDQYGRPRKESQAPVPDDALDRLAYFENQTAPTGYLASGGFGDTQLGITKTVRPGESLINVSVVVPKNLQVPNPRATIQSLAGAAPASAVSASAPAGGGGGKPGVGQD
jgi:hypothetical protein